jgi:hypothetical protein
LFGDTLVFHSVGFINSKFKAGDCSIERFSYWQRPVLFPFSFRCFGKILNFILGGSDFHYKEEQLLIRTQIMDVNEKGELFGDKAFNKSAYLGDYSNSFTAESTFPFGLSSDFGGVVAHAAVSSASHLVFPRGRVPTVWCQHPQNIPEQSYP